MTREELIKSLTLLKEQACNSGVNTFVWDINIDGFNFVIDSAIKALEQEPQTFKWCTDCREYDQEKHCCHRWSKVIRDTVEEMKQGRCDKCEVGNPCLYCKHGFEPQESEET